MRTCLGGKGRARLVVIACAVASVIIPIPAFALHQDSPPVIPLTTDGANTISPGRSWDRNLAFSSTEDLLGNGGTTCGPNASACRQIFVFQLADFDCQQGTTLKTTVCPPQPWLPYLQVTTGAGDPHDPSVSVVNVNGEFRANLVAFDALGGYGGLGGCDANCQQHRQIFTYGIRNNVLQRLTSSSDGDNVMPSFSSLGTVLIFQSTANPAFPLQVRKGPPGIPQVFIYDSGFITQITAGESPSGFASVNRDGGLFALSSTSDLTGDGHDTGVMQIFGGTWDRSAFPRKATLIKLTNGDRDSAHPYLSETGPIVFFDSAATDLPASDVGPGVRVFSARLNEGSLPAVTQYTSAATMGDCTFPTIDAFGNHLSFICTGDPFANGTTGNRLFTLELTDSPPILAQMTGRGDIQGPITANIGNFFVAFSTTEDLANAGSCGRQLALIDFFTTFPTGHGTAKWDGATASGELPPDMGQSIIASSIIGRRQFVWMLGSGGGGSQETVTTGDGSSTAPLTASGRFSFTFGAPDLNTHIASVKIPATGVAFPPIPLPGLGALCVTAVADGAGAIDCNGGNPGGDVILRQDHNTDSGDPLCLLGCREGAACQGGLPGPHQDPCPTCVSGSCNAGFFAGKACSSDVQCQPLTTPKCVNGFCDESQNEGAPCSVSQQCNPASQCHGTTLGVCNGPAIATSIGTYTAGGMTGIIPIGMDLALETGPDGIFCTSDDPPHVVTNIHSTLYLTTGNVSANISNADNVTATRTAPAEQIAAALTGAPFDCDNLRNHKMNGALLAGELVQLDLPDIAGTNGIGLHDVILGLRLAPLATETNACSCTSNIECQDDNPCDSSQCSNGTCIRSTVNCDDGNRCTEDVCDRVAGCRHISLPDGASCSDGDPCNGTETCQSVVCMPGTNTLSDGTPCDDGNPCNGAETCLNHVCTPGTPLANGTTCSDGNMCHSSEACQNQVCVPTGTVNCDDQNPCTIDTCNSVSGCQHANALNGTPCGTGDVCAGAPTCQDGACAPGPPLSDGTACANGDFCHPNSKCSAGACVLSPEKDCSDNNPCTLDSCDAALGCLHEPLPDGTGCFPAGGGNGTGTCIQGICRAGSKLCDDANPCTTDALDPVVGCVHTVVADGTPCANSVVKNLCKAVNACKAGICTAGSAPNCNDGNSCTLDTCDPAIGCVHTPITNLPGVVCQLSALTKVLKAAPSSKFRVPRLRARLIRIAESARKQMNAAVLVDGKSHQQRIRAADNLMKKFVLAVLQQSRTRKLDRDLANDLIGMTRGTETILAPFLN